MTSPTVYIYYDPPYCRCAGLPQGGWLLPAEKGLPAAGDPGEGSEAGQDQHLLHLALTHTQGSKGTGLAGGQSCRNPKCWNLEFQPVQFLADNFLLFTDKFHIFAIKFIINVDNHINIAGP